MPLYAIKVERVSECYLYIEANSEDEARSKFEDYEDVIDEGFDQIISENILSIRLDNYNEE